MRRITWQRVLTAGDHPEWPLLPSAVVGALVGEMEGTVCLYMVTLNENGVPKNWKTVEAARLEAARLLDEDERSVTLAGMAEAEPVALCEEDPR